MLSVDRQVILATTAPMPSVMAVMNLATLPRTAPTRFLHQECHATMADLAQGINTPKTRGTDHTPIMAPDIGNIIADHCPTPIHTMTEAAALEGTLHTLLPAIAIAHAILQPMDAPITPHIVMPTGIVTPHPILTTSPAGATHITPWTEPYLAPADPSMQHRNLSPGKLSKTQEP